MSRPVVTHTPVRELEHDWPLEVWVAGSLLFAPAGLNLLLQWAWEGHAVHLGHRVLPPHCSWGTKWAAHGRQVVQLGAEASQAQGGLLSLLTVYPI